MDWKRVVGKLFLVAAGTGCLVLVMFVLLPWLTTTPEAPEPMGPQEIVEEVLDERMETAALPAEPPAVRLVASPGREAPGMTEALVDEGLPPVLSPEEVAEAISTAGQEPAAPGESVEDAAASLEAAAEEAPERSVPAMPVPSERERAGPAAEREIALGADPVQLAGRVAAAAPPAAVRDVQALLKALGYAPGPVDGVWGQRTEEAWRAFARDAAGRARATVPASAGEPPMVGMPFADEGRSADAAAAVPASRSPSEAPHPSEELPGSAAPEVVQAGDALPGLPAPPVTLPGTLRGVMGYRLPLISRQEVPDQVVSGVLIPSHTTFVILRPGEWELVGLSAEEVERLQDAAAEETPEAEPQPRRRGWNPLRLFRQGGGGR